VALTELVSRGAPKHGPTSMFLLLSLPIAGPLRWNFQRVSAQYDAVVASTPKNKK